MPADQMRGTFGHPVQTVLSRCYSIYFTVATVGLQHTSSVTWQQFAATQLA